MQIADPLFARAVAALDAGDIATLDALVAANPRLVTDRLVTGEPGYFADPYLLWFVAENPIRNHRLPPNITDVAQALIAHVRRLAPATAQAQMDYTLGLVATGCVAREFSLQIPLIEALWAEGARIDSLGSVLGHGELAAARRLLELGTPLQLDAAVSLHRWTEAAPLAASASPADLTDALVIAAYLADADAIRFLLQHGADPSARSQRIHRHCSPLHQAALSGSLPAVKALVEAGADLDARDTMWNGTPAGWAQHEGRSEIESFLRAAR